MPLLLERGPNEMSVSLWWRRGVSSFVFYQWENWQLHLHSNSVGCKKLNARLTQLCAFAVQCSISSQCSGGRDSFPKSRRQNCGTNLVKIIHLRHQISLRQSFSIQELKKPRSFIPPGGVWGIQSFITRLRSKVGLKCTLLVVKLAQPQI